MAFQNHSYDSSDDEFGSGDETDRSSLASDYVYVRQVEEKKNWDKFVQTAPEAGSASEKHTDWYKKAAVALKLISTSITFAVVLVGGSVSKGALFFMLAQIGNNHKPIEYCDNNNNNNTVTNVTFEEKEKIAWLWCVFFAFCAPEIFSMVRSTRVYMMRTVEWAPIPYFAIVFLFETFHTAGAAMLFYLVLPNLDTPRALLVTNGVVIIPGILAVFRPKRHLVLRGLDVLAMLFQVCGLIVWPVMNNSWTDDVDDPYSLYHSWALPLGLFLTSFGWWESFVDEHSKNPVSRFLWKVKINMIEEGSRYTTYFLVSLWKLALFFSLFLTFTVTLGPIAEIGTLFDNAMFSESFRGKGYSLYNVSLDPDSSTMTPTTVPTTTIVTDTSTFSSTTTEEPFYPGLIDLTNMLPLKVLAVQIGCAYAMWIFGKFACKVNIQEVAFALPITLIMPSTVSGIVGMCYKRMEDPCLFNAAHMSHIFFQCPDNDYGSWFGTEGAFYWCLWFLSSLWICSHIWQPKSQRLASTEQMFGTPYYSGLFLEQDIALNRRKDSGKMKFRLDVKHSPSNVSRNGMVIDEPIYDELEMKPSKKQRKISSGQYLDDGATLKPRDNITRIKGCATMWHENSEEMIEMLKSIFRMDEDYCARNLARNILKVEHDDNYEWETHIFFDDAFEPDDSGKHREVNQFVKLLCQQVEEQGKKWYGARRMKVPPPVKYPTPYGGRLIWTLPGATKIICHMKDKDKIRHKKRWSQCMYMYYFLGYQLEANEKLTQAQKELRARNTFLLALDGDVDFQPDAIIKLVDLVKRNPGVGAACGRIHPTGSGFMQWYQKFEYAIGHWLQKSTEHVMGCVLCSPGCFSLFRGEALMDENVMNTYTTVSTEPKHFVQYDQGEDRWLCTLLLQQGWRVEYSAASDSFTACPEGFKEFYNQRRRWMPSTLANILDLLSDWKRVIRNNDDMSFFYIVYQILIMIGTVLGPGSIFIMIAGSISAVFGVGNWESFAMNLVPIVLYVIICLKTKTDFQITVAQLLSIAYALIMVAVIIGLIIQILDEGPTSPNAMLLEFVIASFIVAAIIHPQEFWCLPNLIIYYITIPSMYLLLVIYSIFNLNVVSWGTREVPKKKTAEEQEAEKVKAEEDARKKELKTKNTFLGALFGKDSSTIDLKLKNLFNSHKEKEDAIKEDLVEISKKLGRLEMAIKGEGYTIPVEPAQSILAVPKVLEKKKLSSPSVRIVDPKDSIIRNDLINPLWLEEKELGKGDVKKLKEKEVIFWKDLITKYLKPLEKNAEQEKKVAAGLIELRNSVAFTFIMLNSIWVVAIFILQDHKEGLSVRWSFDPQNVTITYNEEKDQIDFQFDYLYLDPIGLCFMAFFGVVLIVQFLGMIAHRLMTLGHVISTTHIKFALFGKEDKFDPNAMLNKEAVSIVKDLIKNVQPDEREEGMSMEAHVEKVITAGDENELRRMSDGALWSRGKSQLKRSETIKAMKKRASEYSKRKATMKRQHTIKGPNVATIEEAPDDDEEQQQHMPVTRTNTFKDPENLDEREC